MNRRTLLDMLGSLGRHLSGIVAGVLTVGLVAHKLGAPGLGAWALLGVVGFLVGLCDLGLSMGVGRAHAAGDREGSTRAAERALLVALTLSPLLGAAAVGWTLHELRSLDPSLSPGHLAACGALVLTGGVAGSLAMPLRALLVVRGGIPATSGARALGASAQVIALLAGFAATSSLEVPSAAFALGAWVELAALAVAARATEPGLRWHPAAWSAAGLPAALRQGSAVLLINVFVVLALRIDAAVLASVAPLTVIAAYGVAARAVDQTFGLVKQAGVALQPRMSSHQGRDEALELGAWLLPPTVLAAVAALWLAGEPLLRLWVGDVVGPSEFRVALGLLGLASVVAAFSEVANGWLALAAPSAWTSARAIIIGCSLNLVVSVAGRHAWGVWAVAGGTLIGNLVAASLAWFHASRQLGWDHRRTLGALAPSLGALAGATAAGPPAIWLSTQGATLALLGCALAASAALGGAALSVWMLRRSSKPHLAATPTEAPCASGS